MSTDGPGRPTGTDGAERPTSTDPDERPPSDLVAPMRISRRQLLAGGAAASLSAVLLGHDRAIGRLLAELGGEDPGRAAGSPAAAGDAVEQSVPLPSFTFSIARDEDLALLDFAFYNFERVVQSGVTSLRPTGAANVVVVQLPPQSIAEAAYNYEDNGPAPGPWQVDPPPVLAAVSGPSRLCFTLPVGRSVPLPTMTAADLLDWTGWELILPAAAQLGASDTVALLDAEVTRSAATTGFAVPPDPRTSGQLTYIEYPYGLLIAPVVGPAPGAGDLADLAVAAGGDLSAALGGRSEVSRDLAGAPAVFAGRSVPLQGPGGMADCWGASLTIASEASPADGVAVFALDFDAPGGDYTPETYIDYAP